MQESNLINENRIETGIFRGQKKINQGIDEAFRWISWVGQNSVKPDFHVPDVFGVLLLES